MLKIIHNIGRQDSIDIKTDDKEGDRPTKKRKAGDDSDEVELEDEDSNTGRSEATELETLELGGHKLSVELSQHLSQEDTIARRGLMRDHQAFLLFELDRWPKLVREYKKQAEREVKKILREDGAAMENMMKLVVKTLRDSSDAMAHSLIEQGMEQLDALAQHYERQVEWMKEAVPPLDALIEKERGIAEQEENKLLEQKVAKLVRKCLKKRQKVRLECDMFNLFVTKGKQDDEQLPSPKRRKTQVEPVSILEDGLEGSAGAKKS